VDEFFAGLMAGLFAGVVAITLIATLAMPGWHDRVQNAKEQGCTALGAKFESDGGDEDSWENGRCVRGDTIVLRFKDND